MGRYDAAPLSEKLLSPLELFGIRPGLDRIRELLRAAGNPQLRVPTVLVAGTNGKGTTATLLASIGTAAGYRTGLYTSPHLEAVTERIRIDGRCVSDAVLSEHLRTLLEGTEVDRPSYFETLTAAAFSHFCDRRVDLAVVEVGLGGRLDATNACEPRLSVVTSIARDHQERLGSTLPAITREKGGILRAGVPAVSAHQLPEVEKTLQELAGDLSCPLRFVPEDVSTSAVEAGTSSQRVRLRSRRIDCDLRLALLGGHQVDNLALAVAAAETLSDSGWDRLDAPAIVTGVEACRWPGRLEHIDLPGANRPSVLLDAAHNPAAVQALVGYVGSLPVAPDLLFGAMRDKEIESMLPALAACCRRLYLTRAPGRLAGQPRGGDPASWRDLLGARDVVVEDDPTRALSVALDNGRSSEAGDAGRRTLLVCGSLHLVGQVRSLLREQFGVPAAPCALPKNRGPAS